MAHTFKVIQHNVLKWTRNRANELSNFYLKEDADVILLNSIGKQDKNIKLWNYNVFQINEYNEDNAGSTLAIKKKPKS